MQNFPIYVLFHSLLRPPFVLRLLSKEQTGWWIVDVLLLCQIYIHFLWLAVVLYAAWRRLPCVISLLVQVVFWSSLVSLKIDWWCWLRVLFSRIWFVWFLRIFLWCQGVHSSSLALSPRDLLLSFPECFNGGIYFMLFLFGCHRCFAFYSVPVIGK